MGWIYDQEQLVGKKLEGDGHNVPQGYPANHLWRLNKTIKTSLRIADNSQHFSWIPPEHKLGVLNTTSTSPTSDDYVMDLLEEAMCHIHIAGQAKSNKYEEWAEEFLFSRYKIDII